MEFKVKEIAHLLGGRYEGDGDAKINSVAKIEEGHPGGISFLANPKYEPYVYTTKASAVLVNQDFKPEKEVTTTLIRVEDAYTAFTQLLEEYQRIMSLNKKGKEKPVSVGKKTELGKDIYLGGFSYVGSNCKVGDNVKIYPQVYIGDNVEIGDNTIVYAGVKIYSNTKIGSHCTIHAGAVIGSDGFGFAPQKDGSYKTIPQLGNVVIENHVSVGANTVIDCATMGSTVIKEGVKLDNLVQIAHNVEVGEHTVIAAQAGVSGSTKIGRYSMFGGQVGVAGHLKLGDKVMVAAQSGIMKGLKEGSQVMGSPTMDLKPYLKAYAVFKNLPDFSKRIEELEEKVVNLA